MHETRHEIIRIRDSPEPQKVQFYLSETYIFTNLSGPLKVVKMTPTWTQKEPKRRPKATKGHPKGAPKAP